MKTAKELAALVRQRTWDKDVVLWVGSKSALMETLGTTHVELLDLLDLFDEDRLPMDEEETRAQLLQSLREKLKSFQVGPNRRTVLVVKSIGLLVRYDAGSRDFYDWFCGDFGMVVLVLEGRMDESPWPDDVLCEPDRLINYFLDPGLVKDSFGEKG